MFKSRFQVVQFHKSLLTKVWHVQRETIICIANKCYAHQDTLLGTKIHVNYIQTVVYTLENADVHHK